MAWAGISVCSSDHSCLNNLGLLQEIPTNLCIRFFNALAGANMKTTKRIVLVVVMALTGLLVPVSQSSAIEPCFAATPDSAWANGEPAEVTAALGFDLIGTSSRPRSYFSKMSKAVFLNLDHLAEFLLDSKDKVTKYKYIGKNCIERNVVISGGSTPIFLESVDGAKNFFASQAANFKEADSVKLAIDQLVGKLNGKTVKIPVDGKLVSRPRWGYSNAVGALILDKDIKKILQALMIQGTPYPASLIVQFDPKCMSVANISSALRIPENIKIYGMLLPNDGNYPFNLKFSNKNKQCKSNLILTYGGNAYSEVTIAATLGTLTFKPVSA